MNGIARRGFIWLLGMLGLSALQAQPVPTALLTELQEGLHQNLIRDGFSPPVASRAYFYCSVAAYESLQAVQGEGRSLLPALQGGRALPTAPNGLSAAAVLIRVYCSIARRVVYREFLIDSLEARLQRRYLASLAAPLRSRSLRYAEQLTAALGAWMASDLYLQTRNRASFTPGRRAQDWAPTPPLFGDAAEPYFHQLRPGVLPFVPPFTLAPPATYGSDSSAALYREARAVMAAVKLADTLRVRHWDCNPTPTAMQAHLLYLQRQLTPGGHWMGIALDVCRSRGVAALPTAQLLALLATGLYDSFRACWYFKYQYNFLRPVTYIRRYLQPDWQPILVTPPFPEHPSGHACISATAATILEAAFAAPVRFRDTMETRFGLPARSYPNFRAAALEASESRIAGGIHFPTACEAGKALGNDIGQQLLQMLARWIPRLDSAELR